MIETGSEGAAGAHSRAEVELVVKQVIAYQVGLASADAVKGTADFFNDLGGDSLDYAEATISIEEELDLSIPESDIPPKVDAMIDLVMKYVEEGGVSV